MTNVALSGKIGAENSRVRFDEREVASEKPRCGGQLCVNPDTKNKGAAGGGRVAIYACDFVTNETFQARALGGLQVYGQPEDDVNWHGGNGSVYLKQRKGVMIILR